MVDMLQNLEADCGVEATTQRPAQPGQVSVVDIYCHGVARDSYLARNAVSPEASGISTPAAWP